MVEEVVFLVGFSCFQSGALWTLILNTITLHKMPNVAILLVFTKSKDDKFYWFSLLILSHICIRFG